jgi:hypothetical protein
MRTGKRALAGVAAGALALGALTIASAPAASAGKTIKPKGAVTATVNAVRATTQGTSTLTLPYASMGWGGSSYAGSLGSTAIVDLTTAPTASAALTWYRSSGGDDSVTLNNDSKAAGATSFTTPSGYAGLIADDSALFFKVDTAGSYAGVIYNGTDTVSFSFATAGIPTSLTVTPATQTVLVGAQADLAVTLLDATGKATQPQTVDSVALTRSPTDDTIVAYEGAASAAAISSLDNVALSTGTAPFSLNTNPSAAGSTIVTATPAGTLASTGVTAQSGTVVKSGTVASAGVAGMTVSTPANAANGGTRPNFTAQVQNPTTTITVTVDDTTTAAAGNRLRFGAYGASGAVINGQAASSLGTAVFTDVTTDANKKATLTYTISGNALLAGQSITIAQVNVRDDAATPAVNLVVTQTAALVQPSNITVAPTVALAKVGATTPVSLEVDDSFGVPQSGWIVRAYRGTSATAPGSVGSAALVGTTTTSAAGTASLTLTPLSTTGNNGVEYYFYTATAPVGGASAVIASSTTTINYTTSGNIATMSVAPSGSATTFSNTTPTITTAPVILVPDDTAGVPYGTSAGRVTLSTGVNAAEPTGNLATFTVTTTPANDVVATVTAASGLYLSATAPTATTAWSSGKQTVTVGGAGSTPLYVWGTKTGTHDVEFTSGGVTLTGKVKVSNRAQDAYNIAITPDKANVARGGFTTLTAKVTDFWGNPVATTAGAITGVAQGEVLLGGNTNTATFGTNAAGEASITVIAANAAGAGTVTLTPTTAGAPPAWAAGYTKPASFTTAPTLTAISLITVGEAPATKSITITGSRTTVSGKSGIAVDGITVGIEDGKTVTPFIRFPGETTFTAGSARPAIANDEVTWQRKTGKRVTVYLELSDDATIKSNRVTIQAN